MDPETAAAMRGQAVRGVISRVDDGGMVQRVDAQTHDGVARSGIEVLQQFGIASRAPAGAIVVLIAVGGDQGDQVALPVACPSARFGGLAEGETVIYDADGNRVHLRAGGVVEVQAHTKILLKAPRVEIEAPDGVFINGNVNVDGTIQSTGDITAAGKSVEHHRHPETGSTTGEPL